MVVRKTVVPPVPSRSSPARALARMALAVLCLVLAPPEALAEPPNVAPAAAPTPAPSTVEAPVATPPVAPAAEPDGASELELFDLESSLDEMVVSATGLLASAAETPAIVMVITRKEIQERGLQTLADILRAVPGFYDVYDGVFHNVGVRGVNGGLGAAGSVIKVMIDGQPVDYDSTTGNFFGEELLPIEVVDHVEVINGPLSALYGGANAFLGVVNVITRSGDSVHGLELIGKTTLYNGNPGGGGGFVVGGAADRFDFLLAASGEQVNRSGLALPTTGSAASRFADRGETANDFSRPATLFGKVTGNRILGGKVVLLASIQNLDSSDEFFYLNPLSHDSRVSLQNQNYRLSYEATFVERVKVTASGFYFLGAPNGSEAFDTGKIGSLFLPQGRSEGGGGAAEVRVRVHHVLSVALGGDYLQEHEIFQTYSELLTLDQPPPGVLRAGTILPSQNPGGARTFENVGAYLQAILKLDDGLSGIAGLRLDDHNIYGLNPSGRLGAVYAPGEGALSLKLLYGSSFKAPSAEQLFGQPLALGGIQGNDKLQAQVAQNGDLAVAYRLPHGLGEVELNGYLTNIAGGVEYVPVGLYLVAENQQTEWVSGAEMASRLQLVRSLRLDLRASLAKTLSIQQVGGITGLPQILNPLFPELQLHAIANYTLPWWGLHVVGEVSYIGERQASLSNTLLAGSPYTLPQYIYTALALTTMGRRIFPDVDSSIALRVTNVIAQPWAEPGFGGTDVPSQGIVAMLTWVQGF